jgi:hypothetical protein
MVGGRAIDLRPTKRFNNPYCQADFNTRDYSISFGGRTLKLDFSPPARG